MRSLFKSICGIALLCSIVSCDLLLSPEGGRWNSRDPNYDPIQITLTPEIDGFVHGDDIGYFITYNREFAAADLQYDYWHDGVYTGFCYTLIQFDLSVFSKSTFINSAILTLTFNYLDVGAPDPTTIDLSRIVQPWDSATVELEQVISPAFVDGTFVSDSVPNVYPNSYELTVDISLFLDDWVSGSPNYGLRINTGTNYEISSFASEAGSPGPSLTVTYGWIP